VGQLADLEAKTRAISDVARDKAAEDKASRDALKAEERAQAAKIVMGDVEVRTAPSPCAKEHTRFKVLVCLDGKLKLQSKPCPYCLLPFLSWVVGWKQRRISGLDVRVRPVFSLPSGGCKMEVAFEHDEFYYAKVGVCALAVQLITKLEPIKPMERIIKGIYWPVLAFAVLLRARTDFAQWRMVRAACDPPSPSLTPPSGQRLRDAIMDLAPRPSSWIPTLPKLVEACKAAKDYVVEAAETAVSWLDGSHKFPGNGAEPDMYPLLGFPVDHASVMNQFSPEPPKDHSGTTIPLKTPVEIQTLVASPNEAVQKAKTVVEQWQSTYNLGDEAFAPWVGYVLGMCRCAKSSLERNRLLNAFKSYTQFPASVFAFLNEAYPEKTT